MKFETGDKIEIFEDYFLVGKVKNSEIELLTKDDSIKSSKIIFRKEEMILETKREIDSKVEVKGFRLNGKNYQITHQEKDEVYEGNGWRRIVVSEVELLNKKDEFKRKIVSHLGKESIFYNWETLKEEEIIFNPTEEFEEEIKRNNKKFKIKFKDLP